MPANNGIHTNRRNPFLAPESSESSKAATPRDYELIRHENSFRHDCLCLNEQESLLNNSNLTSAYRSTQYLQELVAKELKQNLEDLS